MIERGEGLEDTQVARLIHPAAEPVPVSIYRGAVGIRCRSGFGGTWTARHRRASFHRWPRFARPV